MAQLRQEEILAQIKLWLHLMAFHGENTFRIRAYEGVYKWLSRVPFNWSAIEEGSWANYGSAGIRVKDFVSALLAGTVPVELSAYLERTPSGLLPLLGLRGLSAGRLGQLWKVLGVTSAETLSAACASNQVAKLKGFGVKTQSKIASVLQFHNKWQSYARYEFALHIAETLEAHMCAHCKGLRLYRTGLLRRGQEVIKGLDWVSIGASAGQLIKALNSYRRGYIKVTSSGLLVLSAELTATGFGLRFYISQESQLVKDRFLTTASSGHLHLKDSKGVSLYTHAQSHTYDSESSLYAAAGFPYVPSELREHHLSSESITQAYLSQLVTEEDLKGVLHCHSTDSDGRDSLEDMARYAIKCGYAYLGITDHSQSAAYAGGLSPQRVQAQHKVIEQLNKKLAPFRIFKGIESDILSSGALDYETHVLRQFDFVIASVHSGLDMDEETATTRLLQAIANPYTTLLGHLTGRLLLEREGYPIDHRRILAACAQRGVAIELNANMYRLDLDWRWIRAAQSLGIRIAITPDAHTKESIRDTSIGVLLARKAGLTKDMTLNAYTADKLNAYFKNKKAHA